MGRAVLKVGVAVLKVLAVLKVGVAVLKVLAVLKVGVAVLKVGVAVLKVGMTVLKGCVAVLRVGVAETIGWLEMVVGTPAKWTIWFALFKNSLFSVSLTTILSLSTVTESLSPMLVSMATVSTEVGEAEISSTSEAATSGAINTEPFFFNFNFLLACVRRQNTGVVQNSGRGLHR